ncbi:MAG: RsmB/NOP family class I SAM-dependent RNA methyltransferase [Candidatus Nanohaloarchaea archaeon]
MERYREIIDDWDGFREECRREPLTAVRRNPLKAGEGFEDELRGWFEDVEQADWNPDVFRLPGEKKPGKSLLYWRGEYYVQEESASLPVEVLSPGKGEKILDMCAAPGGKTTQIAAEIENEGLVVANDDNARRMKSLHSNVYRTGSACVTATNRDGRQIPGSGKFDRVLVDAPCSGEGNNARRTFESSDQHERESLPELQYQLLERAADLVRDSGTVVYSTCTFAPEENEEVVLRALEETGMELEEIETGVEHSRGVREFDGSTYGEEMLKTVRVYPHQMRSGGIFVAKFRA